MFLPLSGAAPAVEADAVAPAPAPAARRVAIICSTGGLDEHVMSQANTWAPSTSTAHTCALFLALSLDFRH